MGASMMNFDAQVELPADFATLLIAGVKVERDLGRLVRLDTDRSSTTSSFRYTQGAQDHYFFFSHQAGPWTCGLWISDADLLYWSFDRQKEQHNLILCHGSCATAGGRPVISCDRQIDYAEVSSSGMKGDLSSPHPESVVLQAPLESVWGVDGAMVQGAAPKGIGV
jgi:hypothetical protein